jgi:mitochondrial import receptor subunit TOM40
VESLGNVESLNNTKDCSPATIHGNATSMLRWLFTHVNCASGTEAPGSSGTPPTPGTSGVRKIAAAPDLPLPVKYEELQREIMMSLKADHFEGGRFDFNKQLNQKFFLSHSVLLGSIEVPAQGNQIIKIPNATYEFGANVVDAKYMLVGRLLTDGRMSGRIKYDVSDALSAKLQTSKEPGFAQVMFDLDFKGSDTQAQMKLGNGQFYGVNYLQSVTGTLSLGGEGFWLGGQKKSGVGLAARYADNRSVGTAQLATTGLVSLTYTTKVSEKAMLASDFMWNWNARQTQASVGYDYILRQSRLRGRVDNSGTVSVFLEERLNAGFTLCYSAEIDHANKNHKFGFGMIVGE